MSGWWGFSADEVPNIVWVYYRRIVVAFLAYGIVRRDGLSFYLKVSMVLDLGWHTELHKRGLCLGKFQVPPPYRRAASHEPSQSVVRGWRLGWRLCSRGSRLDRGRTARRWPLFAPAESFPPCPCTQPVWRWANIIWFRTAVGRGPYMG